MLNWEGQVKYIKQYIYKQEAESKKLKNVR